LDAARRQVGGRAASAVDADGDAASLKTVMSTCPECHNAHRETGIGGYKTK